MERQSGVAAGLPKIDGARQASPFGKHRLHVLVLLFQRLDSQGSPVSLQHVVGHSCSWVARRRRRRRYLERRLAIDQIAKGGDARLLTYGHDQPIVMRKGRQRSKRQLLIEQAAALTGHLAVED